jgi:phosphoribosylformimino-5-aminoimidazole carboxamide ribotide isomerase
VKVRIWDIYPAIDLRQGRVVRLVEGDPGRETEYGTDPQAVAERWREAGAAWIHVVNLDGAFGEAGEANLQALEGLVATEARVQFGGGLRSADALRRALDMGVERVVIGTAAVLDPELVSTALRLYGPERIAVGIDARDGLVQTHGWKKSAERAAIELAREWYSRGVRWTIHTDVARDGTGAGLDTAASAALAKASGLHVIGSGGVAGLEDVLQAYRAGLSGIIIGRALYEGDIELAEALAVDAEPD